MKTKLNYLAAPAGSYVPGSEHYKVKAMARRFKTSAVRVKQITTERKQKGGGK